MAVKRKRSSPAFSTASSDASEAQLPVYYGHSKPTEPLLYKPSWSFPTYDDTPSDQHLNCRTRKRHRDNRPDEHQVYATTIHRLFEAQKELPQASPVPSQLPSIPQPTRSQRSTLHSFWSISHPPAAVPPPNHAADGARMSCEDCDRALQPVDAMDLDESTLDSETQCTGCRRRICDACAVLGDERICLACTNGTC